MEILDKFPHLHFLTLVLACSLLPSAVAAQTQPQPNPCVDWGNVQNWTGTLNISGGGTFIDPATGAVTEVSEKGTVTLTGTDAKSGGPCHASQSLYQWSASGALSTISNVSIHDRIDGPSKDIFGNPCTLTTTFDIDGGTSKFSPGVTILLDFTNKANLGYNVGASLTVDGVTEKVTGCGLISSPETLSTFWGPGPGSLPVTSQTSMSLPGTVTTLPVSSPTFSAPGLNSIPADWTVSGSMVPSVPPLDVIVVIPGYDTWRPMGGVNEIDTQGGNNSLAIRACLIRTDQTQIAKGIIPDGWTFNLVKVSHEPGVALNWPPQASLQNPSPPDLAFNQAVNEKTYKNLQLSGDLTNPGNGTILQLLDPLNTPVPELITLLLSSFDWGGWATLNVTAVVNGKQIPGHLGTSTLNNLCSPGGGPNVTDILLPKRQPNSYIADGWKNAHSIALGTPDIDDRETIPGTNNPYYGDGLTLYEEYRGMYVDCPSGNDPAVLASAFCVGMSPAVRSFLHVEGDPEKLDLFVVNDSYPEVLDGIKAFQDGTGIKVCCETLRDDEINGQDKRVINFNYSDGPREGDQHAIVIVQGAGAAPPCTLHGPDKPQNVPKIYYPSMANVLSIAYTEGKAARRTWAQDKYPYSVAHEIAHAVAVSHHGTSDTSDPFSWSSPDGASLEEVLSGKSTPIQAFYEDNKTPVKPSDLGIQKGGAFKIWRGEQGGQHSGDIKCFMRYNRSQSYLPLSDPTGAGSKRFYVPDREPLGRVMTNISDGTGTNGPNWQPQSRYGSSDGVNKFGMCLSQICINDSLAPTPVTPPATGPCVGQTP